MVSLDCTLESLTTSQYIGMRPRHLLFKAPLTAWVENSTLNRGGNTVPPKLPHAWGYALSASFFLLSYACVHNNPPQN